MISHLIQRGVYYVLLYVLYVLHVLLYAAGRRSSVMLIYGKIETTSVFLYPFRKRQGVVMAGYSNLSDTEAPKIPTFQGSENSDIVLG